MTDVPFESESMSRRDVLGRLSFAASLAALPAPCGGMVKRRRSDRALIVIFLDGGLSHLETFDGKPEAPPDVASPLATKEGKIPGVFVTTELPRIREVLDRCALVRTLSSGEGNHDRGSRFVLTGRRPSPVIEYPGLGAVLSGDAGSAETAETTDSNAKRDGALPAFVAIPDAPVGAGPGFRGLVHAPFATGGAVLRPGGLVAALRVAEAARRSADLTDLLDGTATARAR